MSTLRSLRFSFRWFPALVSVLLAGSIWGQGRVLLVDKQDAASFQTIQAAVDAAVSGDVVLVRTTIPTVFSAFAIDGKGLSVIADGPVTVKGPICISNLPSGEYVSLRDLDIRMLAVGSTIGVGLALNLEACAGPVWVEGITTSQLLPSTSLATPLVLVDASNAVLINHSVLDGSGFMNNFGLDFLHNDGVQADGSQVVFLDSLAIGSPGANTVDDSTFPGAGGDGLNLLGGSAFSAGSDFVGGRGGNGGYIGIGCVAALDGGNGVTVDPSASFDYNGGSFTPGLGGVPCNSLNPPGDDGVQIEGLGIDQEEPYRNLEVASPVRGGETSSFQATGATGDLGFMAYGSQPSFLRFVNNGGYLLLPLVPSFLGLGPVDSSGNFSLDVTWPPFPPGVDVLEFYAQVFVIDSGGKAVLGGATSLFVLNQAF